MRADCLVHRPGREHPVRARGAVLITVDDVRSFTRDLPRSYEACVRGRVKFRVGQIVWLAFSRDETTMGFAFPREERQLLIETWPDRFMMPEGYDVRFNWVLARCDALELDEALEFVLDAWRMVVPKKLARALG